VKACVQGAELDVEPAYTMTLCVVSMSCSVLVKSVRNDTRLQTRYLLARDASFALRIGVNPVEVIDISWPFRLLEVASG
jgi:hypothetical protein